MLRTLTFAAASLLSAAAFAQPRCTAIQFPSGASSTSVKGMAPSDVPFACFTLQTGRGQTASLQVAKPAGDIAFNVTDVVDNRDSYSFKTDAKTYHIDVYQMGRSSRPAPFTLQVSVK